DLGRCPVAGTARRAGQGGHRGVRLRAAIGRGGAPDPGPLARLPPVCGGKRGRPDPRRWSGDDPGGGGDPLERADGVVAAGTAPGALPVLPQRWVFGLERKAGVRTDANRGMATARCGNCGAPLTDSLEPTCEHCGVALNDGAHDWVLAQAEPYEMWAARPRETAPARAPAQDGVLDARERQRMLFLMAAMARADGQVDDKELRMLKLCAERWGVPFGGGGQALAADPAVFERIVPSPGPGGEAFLRSLVQMALVDGKVDRQERRMLEATAARLGLTPRLPELLSRFGLG